MTSTSRTPDSKAHSAAVRAPLPEPTTSTSTRQSRAVIVSSEVSLPAVQRNRGARQVPHGRTEQRDHGTADIQLAITDAPQWNGLEELPTFRGVGINPPCQGRRARVGRDAEHPDSILAPFAGRRA